MTESKKPQDSCEHPSFSKEYYLGSHTGDYICDNCKAEFSWGEKEAIVAARSKSKKK